MGWERKTVLSLKELLNQMLEKEGGFLGFSWKALPDKLKTDIQSVTKPLAR